MKDYLVHLGDDGDQEARVQIALVDETFDEGDELRAGPARLREDIQHAQRERLRTGWEGAQEREELPMGWSQRADERRDELLNRLLH